MNTFTDLALPEIFVESLKRKNIIKPTTVQKKIIPQILAGKNTFFESETGTGKTFAFLLPLITKYIYEQNLHQQNPQILILAPTLELASQIKEVVQNLQQEASLSIKSILCIGSSSIKRQINGLKTKPSIVIGNPSRIMELVQLKKLKLGDLKAVVIDEADRQLAKESIDMLKRVFQSLPQTVQYIACSATLSDKEITLLKYKIKETHKTFQETYTKIESKEVITTAIEHWALYAETRNKIDTLRSFINAVGKAKILVFTAPAGNVENIVSKLKFKKIDCAPLYSKLDGAERKKILAQFRSGKISILVTSDLAARGLDITDIDYVVQMNTPSNEDFFIHRAGRTGRAGKKGINLTIGDAYEMEQLQKIEQNLKLIIYPKELRNGKIIAPLEEV